MTSEEVNLDRKLKKEILAELSPEIKIIVIFLIFSALIDKYFFVLHYDQLTQIQRAGWTHFWMTALRGTDLYAGYRLLRLPARARQMESEKLETRRRHAEQEKLNEKNFGGHFEMYGSQLRPNEELLVPLNDPTGYLKGVRVKMSERGDVLTLWIVCPNPKAPHIKWGNIYSRDRSIADRELRIEPASSNGGKIHLTEDMNGENFYSWASTDTHTWSEIKISQDLHELYLYDEVIISYVPHEG